VLGSLEMSPLINKDCLKTEKASPIQVDRYDLNPYISFIPLVGYALRWTLDRISLINCDVYYVVPILLVVKHGCFCIRHDSEMGDSKHTRLSIHRRKKERNGIMPLNPPWQSLDTQC
jgi:hypothetical protein